MISVGDILKILDQIPIWKALREMPKRVAELEARVQKLEAEKAAAPPKPTGRECPMCGAEMKVLAETGHPQFSFAGVKVHTMKCDVCEHTASRDFTPGKGYR